jgi:hypothetical protein
MPALHLHLHTKCTPQGNFFLGRFQGPFSDMEKLFHRPLGSCFRFSAGFWDGGEGYIIFPRGGSGYFRTGHFLTPKYLTHTYQTLTQIHF